jgi:DNA-binding response OmpR family regulator
MTQKTHPDIIVQTPNLVSSSATLLKVLVAEDDSTTRSVLASQIKKLGFLVTSAEDGEEAWARFTKGQPDIVLTDWKMPKSDGLELCRRVRSFDREAYAYVIILTAVDRNAGYLDGMNAGADDFVTKPCDLAELEVRLAVARRILTLQQEVRNLERLLPICPSCKNIRNDKEQWQPVEAYISKVTDAQFSHGVCPDCYKSILEPQIMEVRNRRK